MDYSSKVILSDPGITAIVVYGMITIAVLLSIRRCRGQERFLGVAVTQQLKGLAILLVVLEHLACFTLAETKYFYPGIGIYGVAIFVLLSGFGIMRSHLKKMDTLIEFTKKRIKRIFFPYWFATLFCLVLDYAVHAKTYPAKYLVLTFMGINLDATTQSIDGGVRWFVTYILFCYGFFLLATRFRKKQTQVFILFAVPSTVCLLNLYFKVLHQIPNPWNQYFLLFPAGALIGLYYDKLEKLLMWFSHRPISTMMVSLGFFAACAVFMLYRNRLLPHLPVLYTVGMSVHYLLFISALFLLYTFSWLKQFYSGFFMMLGLFSFEIFLLHVVFMSKYKHLFHFIEIKYSFVIFLTGIILLSYLLKKLSKYCEHLLLPD